MRFINIPLSINTEEITKAVSEIARPIYSKFYEHEDWKTAVFEFENDEDAEKCFNRLNNTEFFGQKVNVELFEHRSHQPRGNFHSKSLADRIGKSFSSRPYNERPKRKPKNRRQNKRIISRAANICTELDAYIDKES